MLYGSLQFVLGCQMISTISVHQPPPYPPQRTLPGLLGGKIHPAKRLLNIQVIRGKTGFLSVVVITMVHFFKK